RADGVLARRGGRIAARGVRPDHGFRARRRRVTARGVRGRRGLLARLRRGLLPGGGGRHGLAAGAARGVGWRGVLRRRGRGWRRAAVLEDGAPLVAGAADGG